MWEIFVFIATYKTEVGSELGKKVDLPMILIG